MPRMSTERARELIRNVTSQVQKDDSAITISSTSFADDESIFISDTSGEANVFDISDDATVNKSAITKSVSNDDDATVFNFTDKEKSKIKRDYNVCGKRFERGSGAKAVRNNLVETKPVSWSNSEFHASYYNIKNPKFIKFKATHAINFILAFQSGTGCSWRHDRISLLMQENRAI